MGRGNGRRSVRQGHKFVRWAKVCTGKVSERGRAAVALECAVGALNKGSLQGLQKAGGEENETLESEAGAEVLGRLEDLGEAACSAPDTEAANESEAAERMSDAQDFQFRDLRYAG